MATNQRTYLPPGRPPMEEAVIAVRKEIWKEWTRKYIGKHCNMKGEQKVKNMTTTAARGYEKLLKRVKTGDIVITKSDKSNHMVVSSMESYYEQGKILTEEDMAINWEKAREIQKL